MGVTSAPAQSADVLVLGDSISAAYGLADQESGWVNLFEKKLQQLLPGSRVINASISGDTTAGGLNRLPQALARNPVDWVILELGANDGLQGLPFTQIKANLTRLIAISRAAGAKVVLLGMRLPPNYGEPYIQRFEAIYRELGQEQSVPWTPFLLEDVALNKNLMQADGLHPNAQAQPVLSEKVWNIMAPLLSSASGNKP